jgi:hypothetical protein
MESTELVRQVLDKGVLVPVLIFAGIVMTVAMKTVGSTIRSVAREKTRREIAAFIAEGSMTPEQGERLMKAGDTPASRCC